MPRLWRYKRDGQEFGPITPDDLKLLADSKRLLPTDLVCKNGTDRWIPARSVRGLFGAAKPGAVLRFLAWYGSAGLKTTALALLGVAAGVAVLLYALHNSGGAAPPPPAVAIAPAAPAAGPAAPAATPPAANAADADRPRHFLGALRAMRQARADLGGGRDVGDRYEGATHALDDAIEQAQKTMRAAGVDAAKANDVPDGAGKFAGRPTRARTQRGPRGAARIPGRGTGRRRPRATAPCTSWAGPRQLQTAVAPRPVSPKSAGGAEGGGPPTASPERETP